MNLMLSFETTHGPFPFLLTRDIVACKWIFKVKQNLNDTIACHKASLVAKGFHQCPRKDFQPSIQWSRPAL